MMVPQQLLNARMTRLDLRARRDAAVAALYPYARTFVAVNMQAVDDRQTAAVADLPHTMTLVTPDHADPTQDHLFVGPHPVLRQHLRWAADFEDLTFSTTTAGGDRIHGELRLTHSRTRAFGSMHMAGVDLAVEYALAPQRYRMTIGQGAAYVDTRTNKVVFDPGSERWKSAPWTTEDVLGFRFGPEGLGRMDDRADLALTAEFDYIPAHTVWRPSEAESTCRIDSRGQLVFELMTGARPIPSSPETNLFPYQMRVQFTAFGESFDGATLTVTNNAQGIAYGLKGVADGGNVAGLYRLGGHGAPATVGVHNRELYIGPRRVPGSALAGDRLSWRGLTADVAAALGLPAEGYLDFSPDGASVVASSFGATGPRVAPDESPEARHYAPVAVGGGPYTLTDIINMTQFATTAQGMYFDEVQEKSLGDFYHILQYYMDPALRRQFISVKEPELSKAVENIAQRPGSKGTNPRTWYHSMGTAYVAQTLSKWSEDPGAKQLNGVRAGVYLNQQSEISDVMAVQSPLLYQYQYTEKYKLKVDWFLLDQRDETKQPQFHAEIDAEITRLKNQIRDDTAGTPEEKDKLYKQLDEFAAACKEKRIYWAFKLYAFALRPAYVNLLQSIMEDPTNDGSMFTQQVQRTIAQLTMLDGSNTVAAEYAKMLQLFEIGNLLPQLADYGGDIEDFNFAVKQIIEGFVKTYLNSPDPALREAAAQLAKDGTVDNIKVLMECLRVAAAVDLGLYNWAMVAERFSTLARQRLGSLPNYVATGILLAAVGLLINFCVVGQINWKDIPATERNLIISAGAGIVATAVVYIARRGLAVGQLFIPGHGFGQALKAFFSPSLLTRAQNTMAQGVRGWLLNTSNAGRSLQRLQWRAAQALAVGNAAEAARLGRAITQQKVITFVFGRNMREFVATRIGAAMAVTGIVLSAIALYHGGEPIEVAVNALFLIASSLEFIAAAGAWGLAFAGVSTIGGLAVGSILAAVSVVGLVVLVAGFILMLVMMFRPEKSPVEKFAEGSGTFFMPHKAAIDSFEVYQPLSQPQRTGLALHTGTLDRTMVVNSDGTVKRGPLDYTGHTAFYARTDDQGRAQISAPIRDSKNLPVLYALSTDDRGSVGATNAIADNANSDPKLLWIAEIQGSGTYEKAANGSDQLHLAPFRIHSAYWAEKGERRYLVPDGTDGWKLSADPGAALTLEVVSMAPRGLSIADIIWFTYQHNESRSPGLDHPGSAPRTWSIRPALPTGIQLDPVTGTIAMVAGADIAPLPATKYTLTVSNALGATGAEFTLEVKVPVGATEILVGV